MPLLHALLTIVMLSAAEHAGALAETSEFMHEYYRFRGSITWVASIPPQRLPSTDLSIDWVAKGAVTPATSQGRCATCQDFSAIADVEGAWHLGGNPLTKLSEQELIDCGGGNQYAVPIPPVSFAF